MEPSDKERLRKTRVAIVEDLAVEDVENDLIQEGVLEADDFAEIKAHPRKKDQAGHLLNLLRGPQAYACFCESLKERYSWLVDKLDSVALSDSVGALAGEVQALKIKEDFNPNVDLDYCLLNQLSRNACVKKEWKWIGRDLGLEEGDITEIEHANRDQLQETVYQMLTKWQQIKGKEATVKALFEILSQRSVQNLQDIFTK